MSLAKEFTRSNLYNFPLDQLEEDSLLSRQTPKDLSELKDSVAELGILQPGVVWVRKDSQGERHHILLMGHSRLKVLRELEKEFPKLNPRYFPCRLVEANSRLDALRMALDENLRRNDLTGMDIYNYLQRLMTEGLVLPNGSPDVPELALFFRKSEAWVTTHLALRNLAPEIQNQVSNGTLATSAAMKLTSLPPQEQKEVLEQAGPSPTREEIVHAKREKKADPQPGDYQARTAKEIRTYFQEVIAGEDPNVMGQALDWKLTTLLVAHAKLLLSFVDGKLTDTQMDNRVSKIFKEVLEDASTNALKRWARKEA